MQSSSLQGKIFPANGVEDIWAIRGKDSVKIKEGEGDFYLRLEPGYWKVIVNARYPFKSVFFDTVDIKRGSAADLGKVTLQKIAPQQISPRTSSPKEQ